MIPPEQLNDMQARCDASYDGPWERDVDATDMILTHNGGNFICEAANDDNAPFIAHARTDLPACIAEIRRLNMIVDLQSNLLVDLRKDLERLND